MFSATVIRAARQGVGERWPDRDAAPGLERAFQSSRRRSRQSRHPDAPRPMRCPSKSIFPRRSRPGARGLRRASPRRKCPSRRRRPAVSLRHMGQAQRRGGILHNILRCDLLLDDRHENRPRLQKSDAVTGGDRRPPPVYFTLEERSETALERRKQLRVGEPVPLPANSGRDGSQKTTPLRESSITKVWTILSPGPATCACRPCCRR